jgi:molybdenum-pterin binding domain
LYPAKNSFRLTYREVKKMKISARNQFKGVVTEIKEGAVNGIVKIDIGSGNIVSATISMDSIRELGLAAGKKGLRRYQGHFGHGSDRLIAAVSD